VNKQPLQLMIGALALGVVVSLPALAAEQPVRWNTGGAVWSTTQDAFETFLRTGEIVDRGLEGGLRLSGWTAEEVRQGMLKTYSVNFLAIARYMYSNAGEEFLRDQTTSPSPIGA